MRNLIKMLRKLWQISIVNCQRLTDLKNILNEQNMTIFGLKD